MISLDILGRAALSTLAISVPTVIEGYRGARNPRVFDKRLDTWSRAIVYQARMEIRVVGTTHVAEGQSYVVMSNHQSLYDIPVMYQALPIPLRMAAKAELFKTPVWGQAMHTSGFVMLERSKGTKAAKALLAARERLVADGTSLWIAPEGTRSVDGKLLEFKRGGFQLALLAKLPILPVTIDGTIAAHRSGSRLVNKGRHVTVTIHQPIDPADYGRKRQAELQSSVREVIASALPEDLR